MRNKVKNLFKDKNLYLFLLISLLFFGTLSGLEFATDSFVFFTSKSLDYAKIFASSGRLVSALFTVIVTFLSLNDVTIYTIMFILAILSTTLAIYKLYNILKENIENRTARCVVSVITIINLFVIELYLFLEKGIMMLSVLFCVMALEKLVSFFKDKHKKDILFVFIFMLLANFCYQGTIGLFVVLALPFILKYSKSFKQFIFNNIVTALLYGIPAFIDYMITKILGNVRTGASIDILESLKKILNLSYTMLIDTYKIIGPYIFLSSIILVILSIGVAIVKKYKNMKNIFVELLKIVYILAGTYIVTVFPQIMTGTEYVSLLPRTTYAFGSILAVLTIFYYMSKYKNKVISYALIFVLFIMLGLEFLSFQSIIRDRYKSNYLDYYIALQIKNKIIAYEEETGNTISKIGYYNHIVQYGYPNLYVYGDTGVKASDTPWSATNIVKYYLGRNLLDVSMGEEIIEKYFSDKKWTGFDTEQILILDDTVYIYYAL